ncbi:AAA family ATPase [Nitriliruptor alkaliphilus]|uniref:AAA family ATPase n=1 Tax=Nitriliruptor alkaliphilus TaxID=427918 RepID=UPI000696D0B7|nr:AAA family ATPase [Nitriliruptor alkaliphilus]
MILVIDPIDELAQQVAGVHSTLRVHREADLGAAEGFLSTWAGDVDVIVVGTAVPTDEALDLGRKLDEAYPTISLVLATVDAGSGVYRQAMRAGFSDVLPWDADHDEISEVLLRAATATQRLRAGAVVEEAVETATTMATFSTKGGCGKSFIATNLAVQLAETYPGEVVLVDLDLQAGDVSIMLQLAPERSILEAAEMGEGLDETALAAYLTPASDGKLRVLAAPMHPVHAEEVKPEDVTRVLTLLRRMFKHVVIDGPPSFTEHVLAAFEQVDIVLVVSSLDVPSIKNLRLSVETLQQIGIGRDRMKLVLNRADSKVGLTVREVEKSLGTTIDITLPSSREVPFAVNQGLPIVTTQPKAAVSKALIEGLRIARSEVTGQPAETDSRRRRRRG